MTRQADVSTAEGCKALFDAAAGAWPGGCAGEQRGHHPDNLILRLTEQDFDAVLDTNLKSVFCCKEAARRMVLRAMAVRIVNLSSVVALRNAGQTNYAASKAAHRPDQEPCLGTGRAERNSERGFIDTDMTTLPEAVRTGMTQTRAAQASRRMWHRQRRFGCRTKQLSHRRCSTAAWHKGETLWKT